MRVDTMLKPMYFEDFYPGLILTSPKCRVSKKEIIDFAAEWDPQDFHLDEEAAKNSVFGDISACSAHIFAIMSKLGGFMTPGLEPQVIAGLGFDKLRMIKPLFAEDVVSFQDRIQIARRSKSKADRGIVTSHGQLINQHNEVVFEADTTFLIKVKPHSV